MTTIADIKETVRQRLKGSAEGDICASLLTYIEETPNSCLAMLTYQDLYDALSAEVEQKTFFQAVQIISGDAVRALDIGYILEDEDGNEHELSSKTVLKAIEEGVLYHPETGSIIPNFKYRVSIFFSLSEYFASLKVG